MGKGSWRCLTLVQWFLKNRSDLARTVTMMECSQAPLAGRRAPSGPRLHEHLAKAARHASSHPGHGPSKLYQFAIPSCERLKALLDKLFDPGEFLSAFGIRSLSRYHEQHPYVWTTRTGTELRVSYSPAESPSRLFGGNSSWRGPVWMPTNFLIVESLERFSNFYGDTLQVEYPTHSGKRWPQSASISGRA